MGLSKDAQSIQEKLFDQLAALSRRQHERLTAGEKIDSVQKVGITTEFVEADVDD